jgi:glycosyltransferase involved in cell wall biosynthesis
MPAKFKVAFILTQTPGVSWYRNVSFAEKMKAEIEYFPGWFPEKLPNWEDFLQNNKEFAREIASYFMWADIVVAQRCSTILGAATLLSLARHYKKPLLCEIDDYVFNIDSSNPGFYSVDPGSRGFDAFKFQLEQSYGIVVSTRYLKSEYEKHLRATLKDKSPEIYVVKNCIDFSLWDKTKKKRTKNKRIKIGWQGASHHYNDLQILSSVIPKILREHKNVEFHFFGLLPDFLKQERVYYHEPVPIMKYPQKITSLNLDIMLAPLHDSPFNRAKSNLRVLEAGAMKKPVIATANKNQPYAGTITHGYDGYLTSKPEEWVDYIKLLLGKEPLRKRIGQNLYKTVKKEFNVKDEAKRYEGLLRRVCNEFQRNLHKSSKLHK